MAKFVLTAQLQLQAPSNVRQVVSQIQNQLKGINVDINVRGSNQAQRQIRQIADESNRATTAAGNMGRALGVSIRRFTGLAIATRAVSLFTNSLGAAVKESIAFERELVKISQVTGKTVSQLKDLTNTITSLATGLGVSSTSLLQTSRILSQAGLSARETEIALKALAKTALAPTFDDIGRTAEGAVAIFNQFRQGAGALEGQLGSLNAVAGKFAVESGDLISVIRRTGGVFKAAGGDLNQLIALFTSVRSTTRESAESIATGLRTILTRIQRPRTIEYLRQYGVELETLEGKFVGPYEAIRRLSQATAGLEQGDLRFIEIAEEIAGFRQIGKVIPLLREFRVAQEALVVAQGGVNSLTDDAAKAQLSLAVRITKVKEQFLSLVRSITETTTFQVMAATVLTLAESLIRLGEAIKPILPLLSALVAFRAVTGFGNFFRSIPQGFGNARGFASGGMVPGTGNRDTVPAMLTPGEFVIKKSSVAKLGAGNLEAMNNNKFAAGGIVTSNRHAYGKTGTAPKKFRNSQGMDEAQIAAAAERKKLRDAKEAEARGNDPDGPKIKPIKGGRFSAKFGVSFASPKPSSLDTTIKGVRNAASSKARRVIDRELSLAFKQLNPEANIQNVDQIVKQYVLNGAPLQVGGGKTYSLRDGKSGDIYDSMIEKRIPRMFRAANSVFNGTPFKDTQQYSARQLLGNSALGAIEGGFFEALVRSITNSPLSKQEQKENSVFDFTSLKPKELTDLFGSKRLRFPNEFKNRASPENIQSAVSKAFTLPSKKVKFFNTGGPVGTDTVPALLTPGEFVVNRRSAQNIGYGALNRMNKVGKYAKGGVVQRFQDGGGVAPSVRSSLDAFRANPAGPALQKVAKSAEEASVKMEKSGNNAFLLGTSVLAVQSGLSALRPTIDENSSAFKKNVASIIDAGQGLIGIITTVGIALQTFGVQLNAANIRGVFDLITSGTGKFARSLKLTGITLARRFGGNAKLFGKLAVTAGRLATGLGVAAVATSALKGLSDTFFDFDNRLQKSISEGNVEEAGAIARSKQASDAAFGATGGALTGAAIGSLFGPVGTAVGAVAGGLYGLLSSVDSTKVAFAETRARLAKADIDLKSATDAAAKSLEKFKTKADDANRQELTQNVAQAQDELIKSSKLAGTEIEKLSQQQSGVYVPFSTELGFSDRVDRYSTGRNDENIKQIQEQSTKSLQENIKANQAGTDAIIRDVITRGGTAEDVKAAGVDPEKFFKAANEAFSESVRALKRGDKVAQAAALERAKILREEGQRQQTAIDNQIKAIDDLNNKLKTFSVSLSQAIGAANAANVSLSNLQNSFDPSKSGLQNSISTLEASTTSAARGMDAAQFDAALNSASEAMLAYGAGAEEVNKFKTNLAGVASAQKELPTIIAQVDDQIRQSGSIDPADQLRTFTSAIDKQLKQANIDSATRKAFVDELGKDLTDEEKQKVRAGGTSRERVFEERLKKLGDTVNQDAIPAIKAIAENDEKLASILRKRIESENNLIKAQQQAVDIFLEARQLEAGFGGAPVTTAERRQAVAARSNVLGRAAGLSDVGTDVASFRRRREEIRSGFAATQSRRSQILAGGGAASAAEKTALTGQEDRLRQAQQDQIKSLRDLIKIQQDEIKTIQEKQRLEKESLDSLLTGDIDKFFEQQAAQGAIAAAATGNAQVMGAFGADATAAAAKELQRLQAAGVTEIYGQQIGGAGGLAETTALAGFRQRGLSGQAAVRASQIQAGTTEEQLQAEAVGRQLTSELAAAGELGADMAADELSIAAQALQQAAYDISNAINQSGASTQRGVLTGQRLENERQVAAQQSIVNDAQAAAIAKEEEATRAQAQFNKSKYAGMSNQELLSLPTDEYNKAMRMRAEARYDLPREAEALRSEEASQRSELQRRQLEGRGIQKQFEATGSAGFSVGGLDEQSAETLNNFANSVQSLQGMEVAHKLGDMNINFGGVDFLANMQPEIRNTVIDELQKQLENYRPSSAGMRKNNSVLPTS